MKNCKVDSKSKSNCGLYRVNEFNWITYTSNFLEILYIARFPCDSKSPSLTPSSSRIWQFTGGIVEVGQ